MKRLHVFSTIDSRAEIQMALMDFVHLAPTVPEPVELPVSLQIFITFVPKNNRRLIWIGYNIQIMHT